MARAYIWSAAIVLSTLMASCGGGSGGSQDQLPSGIFHGTMTVAGSAATGITGTIDEGGRAFFYSTSTGDIFAGDIGANGGRLEGSLEQYIAKASNPYVTPSPVNSLYRDSTHFSGGVVSGAIVEGQSISGTYTGKDLANNPVTATFSLEFDSQYNVNPPDVSKLPPSAWDYCHAGRLTRITFSSSHHDGTFTLGGRSTCGGQGQLTVYDPSFNAYRVTMNESCGEGTYISEIGMATYMPAFGESPETLVVGTSYDRYAGVGVFTRAADPTTMPACPNDG